MKRKLIALILAVTVFLAPVLAAEQILKPTSHTDNEGATSSPTNAYDKSEYDDTTASVTSELRGDSSITFHTWDTTNRKSYVDLNLSVTVTSSSFNDDTWAIYYDATTDTTCDSTDSVLKASGSQSVNLRNYTVSISPSQNLADLEVCLSGAKVRGRDRSRSVSIYDIRTKGLSDETPPEWRNQQQNTSIIAGGDAVELSAQGRDNFNLSGAVLSTNETGAWDNKSVYGSPVFPGTSNTWTWTNFTWQNASMESSTVSWKIWYNDSAGQYNATELKSFEIDAEKPAVNIHSPVNQIYGSSDVDLKVSADEQISNWKHNLDSNGNTTFTPNKTLTGLSEGVHTVKVWAEDQAGNWNSTSVSFEVDTTPPQFSNRKEQPSDPVPYRDRQYRFNITVSDSNTDTVNLEFDGTNYTPQVSGSEYYVDINALSAGTHAYRWYANDTVGNDNATQQFSYQVDKAVTNTSTYLNGTLGDLQYEYNSTANLSVDLNVSETVELWDNLSGSMQQRNSGAPLLEEILDLDYSLGTYRIKGVFFGNENYTAGNESSYLDIVDTTNPSASSLSDDEAGKIYKGESIELRALWSDNYQLGSSILSVNSSGSFQNVSTKSLSGADSWANFSYSVPTDSFPGTLGWKQYANDSSSNYGATAVQEQEVWGYSETNTTLNDTSVQAGEAVKTSCRVEDANSSSYVSSYNVEVYNGTVLLDQGSTGANGWFNTSFSIQEAQDNVPVKCAIYDDSSKQYTASSNSSEDLTVNSGNPPVLENGTYDLNNTELTVGDSVKIYAQWNDSLNYSFVEYDNQTQDSYLTDYKQAPFTDGWTNFTLDTGQDWFKGTHSVKIYANDSKGNLNNTLERLKFDVNGFSNVNYLGPKVEAERGTVELRAEVVDANISEKVSGYNVTFWNNGTKLGEVETNSSGVAAYNWDTSSLEVGEKQVKATINNSEYYTAVNNESSASFNLTGFLEPVTSEPSGILHRGVSESFSGEVYDDTGAVVSVDSADWLNSTGDLLAQGKSTSWSVPGDYQLGSETITFNVSKQFHQYNSTSVGVEIYGYSKISSNSFNDSKINEGESSAYRCRVTAENTGSGIQNYPVVFYNGTEQIETVQTNSTGWATTTFTDNTSGNETYECQIADSSDLNYNVTIPYSATSELETVDITLPEFTVDHPPEGSTFQKEQVRWFNTTWTDNFNLSTAVFSFNDSGSFQNSTIDLSGTSDEADYSFTNTSFEGVLGYRVYGNDTYNNFNSTSTRTATIYGGSDLYSIDTTSSKVSPGNTVNVTCGVRDNVTSGAISNYQVEFYNGTTLEDTALTNETGYTEFNYSQSFEGNVNLECRISDNLSQYYKADNTQLSETVSFEFGDSRENYDGLTFNGGRLVGPRSRIDSLDGNFLNWTDIENTTSPRTNTLRVNSSTEIPPEAITSVEFRWDVLRGVKNFPEAVNDPANTDGTITFSNGDINSTWSYDAEYAEVTEAKSGNTENLARKGFYFYLPETESEVTIDKLDIEAEVLSVNNEGESVDADLYNYATSSYLNCFEYGSTSWGNVSCSITDSVTASELVSTDQISLEFQDGSSIKNELQSSWRFDRIQVTAYYTNPETGNTFEYTTGFRNRSSGVLENIGRHRINGTRELVSGKQSSTANQLVGKDGSIEGYLSFHTNNTPNTDSYRKHEFAIDRYRTRVNYEVSKSKDLEIETRNSSGQGIEGVQYEVYDSGQLIDNLTSQGENFTDKFAEGKNYNLKHSIPDGADDFNVTYRNFSLSESFDMRTRLVNYSELSSAGLVRNVSKIYAVDDTGFSFDNATLKVPKEGTAPDIILHCKDYDFANNDCGNWEVNKTSEYATMETANYFIFNVTGFDAFGTGNGEPLPNVTNISVYDVTGLSQQEKETGGTLEASGLNKTFQFDQYDRRREYRFEFKIRNDGTQDWVLENGDQLYHDGLNTTWNVGKKWYNISGTQYTGGTFSGGRVDWDTGQGGTLNKQKQNDDMWAKYLVNISTTESSLYSEHFLVNDTSNNVGSEDYHELNITKYGFLDVVMEEPLDGTVVSQNKTFSFNASINCREGRCGDTNISVRYNQSSTADTLVPENSGKPFHTTQNQNTLRCGSGMKSGESCSRNWSINATGELYSLHLMDANATSDLAGVEDNDSADNEVRINLAVLIDVKWDKIDFGLLEPGKLDQPAQGNDNSKYNITVDRNSIDVDDIWVKTSNLTTGGWGDYYIPVENTSYALSNDVSQEKTLSRNYSRVASDVSPGTNLTTYYWIDIPGGIKSAKYNSTIYFKANATR